MNYVSQRLNEGALLSTALCEAMEPPRNYTEPDPRIDLGGDDFVRKLVILGRICGNRVERDMVQVESILSDELKEMAVNDFLEALPSLDSEMGRRAEDAKWDGNRIWYMGEGDLENDEYSIGFKEVPVGDPITRSRESDNVLTIHPRLWRRPVTVMGPGAGPQETVAGILSGLSSIHSLCH
jgi:homoserine dehydrogenase